MLPYAHCIYTDTMGTTVTRANMIIPEDLLRKVDALAGPRGRTQYVVDTLARQVRRDLLARALDETFGVTSGDPGHRDTGEVARWVRELRAGDRDR